MQAAAATIKTIKVADLEVEDLQHLIQASLQDYTETTLQPTLRTALEDYTATTLLPAINTAITQSEMRVIDLLCDRMDEGFNQLRQEMQAGFADMVTSFENLASLIDHDYKALDKRLKRLERGPAKA